MSLPIVPPAGQSPVIRRGQTGWPVYALQDALSAVGPALVRDGVFGSVTEVAVKKFQAIQKLTTDGVAGPITQANLVIVACRAVESSLTDMPKGLIRGVALGEGGLALAPVNDNGDGVDCGAVQYHVPGPPFDQAALKAAFSIVSVKRAAQEFMERRDLFLSEAWVRKQPDRYEAAGLVAAFAHNWPTQGGADYYAVYGHVQNPDRPCSWVPRNRDGSIAVHFPDGAPVVTRGDWAAWYAIGGPHGPGLITAYVTAWR